MYKREREREGPLEKGTMWSYSKQRQPWQLQKRLQTMLPAASLRHLSGCLPGTIFAFAQHLFFAFESKNRGLSSPLLFLLWPRERWGDEDEDEDDEDEDEEVLILYSHPRSLSLVLLSTLCLERKIGERERERRIKKGLSSACHNVPTSKFVSFYFKSRNGQAIANIIDLFLFFFWEIITYPMFH